MADPHSAGDFAVYQGTVYRAFGDATSTTVALAREPGDPVPEGLQPDPHAPGRVYVVEPERLESWYRTRWTFRWQGEPFAAVGSRDERITGMYTGRNQRFADEHCQRLGMYEYMGVFPLSEVTELTEHRTDLLAEWTAEHPQ